MAAHLLSAHYLPGRRRSPPSWFPRAPCRRRPARGAARLLAYVRSPAWLRAPRPWPAPQPAATGRAAA